MAVTPTAATSIRSAVNHLCDACNTENKSLNSHENNARALRVSL